MVVGRHRGIGVFGGVLRGRVVAVGDAHHVVFQQDAHVAASLVQLFTRNQQEGDVQPARGMDLITMNKQKQKKHKNCNFNT
jgi:hypothetical protein